MDNSSEGYLGEDWQYLPKKRVFIFSLGELIALLIWAAILAGIWFFHDLFGPLEWLYNVIFVGGSNWTVLVRIGLAIALFIILVDMTWGAYVRTLDRYLVGAKRVSFVSGFLSRTSRTIPASRVQSVTVETGPLQRLFSLCSIEIKTAGTTGNSIEMAHIPKDLADSLERRFGSDS